MKKVALIVIVLLISLLMLAACGGNGQEQAQTGTAIPPTPTNTATPTPTLPATFTPVAVGQGGHLFAVSTRSIHIVQPGETLGSLAAQYGVTVQELARANRITNYNLIETGDVLYIPPC